MGESVTESVTDTAGNLCSGLNLGLQLLNTAVDDMSRASLLNKSAAADRVLKNARELIANIVLVLVPNLYAVENLNKRLEAVEKELERIGNIGVIKNG